jgi:hypothetical protein
MMTVVGRKYHLRRRDDTLDGGLAGVAEGFALDRDRGCGRTLPLSSSVVAGGRTGDDLDEVGFPFDKRNFFLPWVVLVLALAD